MDQFFYQIFFSDQAFFYSKCNGPLIFVFMIEKNNFQFAVIIFFAVIILFAVII